MRILALATEAFDGFGGIAQANRDLFRALSSSHEVVILPRRSSQKTFAEKNMTQKEPILNEVAYSLRALATLRREGPFDLIFCGHLFMAPLAAFLPVFGKTPFWIHVHGIEAWRRPSGRVRAAAEKAAFVTAVSRYTRRKFLSWVNLSPEKVKVLPDTVEERFSPGPRPEELVRRYGVSGKKVLLTVGRLAASERYKGHDRVLEALVELRKIRSDIVYLIAGDGDDRPRLEWRAAELGLLGDVHFLGKVDDRELPELYRLADVFVMPSTGEGFGIAFLEAAASGVPVVGANRDGSVDPLADGEAGRLVDPGNSEALESAIRQSLESPHQVPFALKRFSRGNFNRRTNRLVELVLDSLVPDGC